ncbi:hypothetical protein K3G63_07590 [Hymenobacter sp. HSC-4F20]|nr:hypothetical protein [Hymenobacter sp. HSC-4F20]
MALRGWQERERHELQLQAYQQQKCAAKGQSNQITAQTHELIAGVPGAIETDLLQAKLEALDGKDFIAAYRKQAEFVPASCNTPP